MGRRVIVTSALLYINGMPHLGNFIGAVLPADLYSRYLKMAGIEHIFICGSDQHGTPVELSAIRNKTDPEKFADMMHERTKAALEKMECDFTYYGKTHTEENKKVVYRLFEALDRNGYISNEETVQAYCSFDKRFIPDRMIEGKCPHCDGMHARGDQCDDCGKLLDPQDLIDPKCTICGNSKIEFRSTKNLALDLPKLTENITSFVERIKGSMSKNALNKTTSYIELGLKPRQITRDLKWGFSVPKEGFEDKVFYVWFDAVIGYIGITNEWSEEEAERYWLGNDTELVHFMGKDNIEFHTMMWPGILSGARLGYAMPTRIMAYEYLNSGKIKFSKSRGIGLNIENAIEVMSAEQWRFVLSYLLPETSDTEFSEELIFEIVNKIMNDKIGNLINRAVVISSRNGSLLSAGGISAEAGDKLRMALDSYRENFENARMRESLKRIVELADYGNEIMSMKRPWELAKAGDAGQFSAVMSDVLHICKYIGVMIWPYTPKASAAILYNFGIRSEPRLSMLSGSLGFAPGENQVQLFSKIGDKERETLLGFG